MLITHLYTVVYTWFHTEQSDTGKFLNVRSLSLSQCLTVVYLMCRAAMMEGSGTLEEQLEATKVGCSLNISHPPLVYLCTDMWFDFVSLSKMF